MNQQEPKRLKRMIYKIFTIPLTYKCLKLKKKLEGKESGKPLHNSKLIQKEKKY